MSRFEALRTWEKQSQPPRKSSKFDGLRIQGADEMPEGDSWRQLIGKSVVDKGLGPLLGIPNLLAQGVEGLARGGAEAKRRELESMGLETYDETPEINGLSSNIPTWENIRDYTKDKTGVDFEARPTTGTQRIASEIVGVATPGGLFGLFGKGAKALKVATGVGTGAVVGALSGGAKEAGVNPVVADIGSSLFGPSIASKLNPKNLLNNFKNIPETVAKVPLNIMGLTGKNFNLPAAQAARDLGIDLPAAALTNSRLTSFANQLIGKTPFFGSKLVDKYATAEQQALEALHKIYDEVGPQKSPEVLEEINRLFDNRNNLLPKGELTDPSLLIKKAKEITNGAAAKDEDLIKLLKHKKQVLDQFDNTKLNKKWGVTSNGNPVNFDIPPSPALVQDLMDQQRAFNNIIWGKGQPLTGDFKTGQKHMRSGVVDALDEYGLKRNPEWHNEYKKSNDLFSRAERRADLENTINDTAIDATTKNINHSALTKKLHDSTFNQSLKKEVSPEIYQKIQKLGEVSRALAANSKSAPKALNSSKSNLISLIVGLTANSYADAGSLAATVSGMAVTTKLLTDKKFVDLALKYAEKPNLAASMSLSKRIKEITGYSAIALNKALQNRGEE